MSTTTRIIHRSPGAERLFSAKLLVLATHPLSATDYWTFTLRHRRIVANVLQTYGELVGVTFSTQTRIIPAGEPDKAVLYDDPTGRPMQEGELLVLTIISTGSPVALEDPRVIPDIRPNVR